MWFPQSNDWVILNSMKYYATLLFFLVLSLTACRSTIEEENKILRSVLKEFGEDFSKDYNFNVIAEEVHEHSGEIFVHIHFRGQQRWKIQDGRACIVEGTRRLIERIHSTGIRHDLPELARYPHQNLDFSVSFETEEGQTPSLVNISHVYLLDGIINYSIWDPEDDTLKKLYRETYLEAVNNIKGETP